ncbi:MAG: ATP synthase F1 subunit gamma [Clostridia bacterium]|nr:ATP synthase F1 subunit gamma [Clostridia bacterium]
MAYTNENDIKARIAGIRDTRKITNAMYLIASTKMRKAKAALDLTRPYFDALHVEIARVFRTVSNAESRFFYPQEGEEDLPGAYGYLVITADRGLAGAYNLSVLKEMHRLLALHGESRVYMVGDYGRQYCRTHGVAVEEGFRFSAQDATLHRAREISAILLDAYEAGEITKLFLIYTDFCNGLQTNVVAEPILPFHRAAFLKSSKSKSRSRRASEAFEFYPSVTQVLDQIVPSYVIGYIYSALVDSFCSEQNARMTAMDSANQNAQQLIDTLTLEYNHLRQNAVTQEITEISAGAKAQKRSKGGSGI